MIPIDQCLHGHLYALDSRNLSCGVYCSDTNGFIGIREKYGELYLFEEFHWDTGPPHGTAKPLTLICECPIKLNEIFVHLTPGLFEWLSVRGETHGD